jgi:uncharacterized spore protein YtfJ
MPINVNVNENVTLLFEKLREFLTSKTVIGEPMTLGDTTLIPVINVQFGLGAGGGDGTDSKGNGGVGGGAGIGAKVAPTAIIVIKGEKIEILPIKKSSGLEKLIEMVPDIVDKVNVNAEKKENNEDNEKAEE